MPRQPEKPQPNEILVGVEGDRVTPSNFDVLPSLRFFHAFVELMQAVAKAERRTLEFTGMRVHSGSAALALTARDVGLAEQMAERAQLYLVGDAEPPRGLQTQVAELQDALEKLPREMSPFYEAHERRRPLPTKFAVGSTLVEVTEYRGIVRLVGGNEPRVVLAVRAANLTHLNLHTSEELVQRAAGYLYKTIDAVVRLTWCGEKIVAAELEEFTPIEEGLTPEAEAARWREWFAVAGAGWNEVEDIEAELRGEMT